MRDPGAPTTSELDQRFLSHIPFVSWFPHCFSGRARYNAHRRRIATPDCKIPHVVVDDGFLSGDQDSETIVVRAERDALSGFLFSHVIPRKGLAHVHGAAALIDERLGHDTLTIKADNEPAMRRLQEEIQRRRDKPTLLENSPVGQSEANGMAERAVQAVSEQIRVMGQELRNRVGVLLPARHPVMAWMVEHVSELVSAFQRGPDGKAAFERVRGKPYKRNLTEFAEKVAYRTGKIDHIKKLGARWNEGLFWE